jgi:hypothetical protein
MTDPVSPIGSIGGAAGARRAASRSVDADSDADTSVGEDGGSNLPAVLEQQPPPPPPPARSKRAAFAAFAAQIMGQGGQRRGLRGGQETLDKARSTYLETEWSGPSDRRVQTGRITKTDV